jgi:hypothetical protein
MHVPAEGKVGGKRRSETGSRKPEAGSRENNGGGE